MAAFTTHGATFDGTLGLVLGCRESDSSAVVVSVKTGGAASTQGVAVGDVIARVNGRRAGDYDGVLAVMADVGRPVTILFEREVGAPAAAAPPAAAPAPGGRNDWPAPEGVDPNVWSQLPEDMQRELLLQRGMEEPGGGRSAPAPTAPPPPASLRPAAASHGADAYRVARAPATGSEGVVQVEVLARISQRTLATKVWKPAVAVVKGHRELLVFRSSSDWAQYRNAAVHGGGDVDIIQALKNVSSLLKKHVMLTGAHKCSPIKMKDYKAVGALHHFTLEEANNAVVAKFAAKHDAPLFELRAAIATAIRNARGGGGDYGAPPPNADAVGRYAA